MGQNSVVARSTGTTLVRSPSNNIPWTPISLRSNGFIHKKVKSLFQFLIKPSFTSSHSWDHLYTTYISLNTLKYIPEATRKQIIKYCVFNVLFL
ncbi:hypothetical protein SOVF_102440 [Spinacia oleracea]|nr:hypothetical protein SOVF_102440 [Spinacia oleracea]